MSTHPSPVQSNTLALATVPTLRNMLLIADAALSVPSPPPINNALPEGDDDDNVSTSTAPSTFASNTVTCVTGPTPDVDELTNTFEPLFNITVTPLPTDGAAATTSCHPSPFTSPNATLAALTPNTAGIRTGLWLQSPSLPFTLSVSSSVPSGVDETAISEYAKPPIPLVLLRELHAVAVACALKHRAPVALPVPAGQ